MGFMDTFILTARELGELESLIRHPGSPAFLRAQAMLWLANGFSAEEVADLLNVSRQTIYNWATRFRERAGQELLERLADAPRSGRPPTGKGIIDPWIEAVIDRDPRVFGLRAASWTAPLLCQYLWQEHQVEVSRKTVARALDRLGLHWKRPRHQLALRPDTWRQAKGGFCVA
jgi:transposase